MQNKDENDDFEDLDFEDLDADDDFDESWDDFDDVDDAEDMADTPVADEAAEESSGKTDDAPAQKAAASGAKKKSFIQKNFNLIVIGIAVLGGGSFALSKLAAPPAGQSAQQEMDGMGETAAALTEPPAEIPELSGDMPPMPSPMDTSAEAEIPEISDDLSDFDLALEEAVDLPSEELKGSADLLPQSDDVLTPLPELSENADNAELADLDDLSDFDLALEEAVEDVVPAPEEAATLDISSLDVLPEDVVVEDPSPALDIEVEIKETDLSQAQEVLEIDPAPVLDEPVAELQLEEPVLEDAPALAAPIDDTETLALENEVQALNESMSEKDSALEQASEEKEQLSVKLGEAQTKISELESKVAALEAELKDAKAAPVPAPKKAESSAPAPETQAPEKVESTTAAPPKVQAEKPVAAKAKPTTSWVLRSAQPGIATLSPKDSNDLRRVEVGDIVSGLGRIQSISVEDGKWVVRGSKGRVTQ